MKKKVLLSLDPDVAELLEKEARDQGINKSQVVTRLLKDNIENRLSKHIVRALENLLLYLILQNENLKEIKKDELIEKLDYIYKQGKIIRTSKSILLREERNKRKTQLKTFWNNILKMLEPNNFYNEIGYKDGKIDITKTKNFLKKLHQ